MDRRFRIAAYDVRDPRRLQQALHVLKGYSTGGQKSVFECFLTNTHHAELLRGVRAVVDPGEDLFFTVEAQTGPAVRTLGIAIPPEDPEIFYIG
ncbi:MAG: CRISPR-associated endonuclease Cas2 [Bryobacterales bacterium]|nr:CRISPR-associated endonuclease Cas2 [Bryobacterales bacterium]